MGRTTLNEFLLLLLATSLGAIAPRASAQDPRLDSGLPLTPEQACYDVLSYDLAVEVDPEQQSIAGLLRMRARMLRPAETICLDLDERLVVGEARCDDRVVIALCKEGRIYLSSQPAFHESGAEFEVSIQYAGKPRVAPNPPWSGGFTWAKTPSGAPWIATSCQGEGADLWWPVKDQPDDEPDAMDIRVTVPEPLVCASNGRLVQVAQARPGWRTYHWHVSTPINAYSVALNIAPYATIEGVYTSIAGESFPVVYYVLPENYEKGKALYQEIRDNLAFFEEVFGPYPFRADKCGVAETPHLGMEHQTITAYGNEYKGNPWGKQQGFDFLLQHEMAHEYWALQVTARNWNDFWIHEGIGSYAQPLYAERLRGKEGYRQVMREQRRSIRNNGAVAPRDPHSSQEMYFTKLWPESPAGDIYSKGSWIVHSLRYLLGDATFFRVLRRWAYPTPALEKATGGAQCRFATTDELLAIAERESGRELDWFFELYLRQPKLPKLLQRVEGDRLLLEWETPGGLAFPMPVEVRVGESLRRVELPDGKAAVELGGASDPQVDPDEWILRERS